MAVALAIRAAIDDARGLEFRCGVILSTPPMGLVCVFYSGPYLKS